MTHWYEHAIIYQIYPKSFQDSNDDGIGDLNGIRQRLPYLQQLGINTIWLNPIFVSPQVDNGYDVADYFKIDPRMGTMKDMKALIAACHQVGIHVLLDFVLNHTSDQNEWFQKAKSDPHSQYRDYYIFAGANNQRPNNWGSFFGGSVWEPDPAGTGQFYFHLFDKHMPDLNWRNPKVRQEMLKIAEFWLAQGIDGLRLDAFIHIAKADLRQSFPVKEIANENNQTIVAEPFFANLPQVQKWLRPFCEQIKKDYPEALLLGEAASANVNLAADYTAKDHHLLDSVVTFRYFKDDQRHIDPNLPAAVQPKGLDWDAFKKTQVIWQQTLAQVSQPTLYWSNHDMPRLASRIAKTETQARSLAMLMYLQRGIPIIYYGEELGLKNLLFTAKEEFNDQEVEGFITKAADWDLTKAAALKMVSQAHKMPARGPMPWTAKKPNYGFSKVRPWLEGQSQNNANVQAELDDPDSMFNFYRQLISLKKTALFQSGSFYLLATANDSYVYQRDLANDSAIVAVSLSSQKLRIKLPSEYRKVMLTAGQHYLNNDELILMPYSGVVLSK